MVNKYLHWLSAATLSIALALMLYVSFLLLWPFKVLELGPDFSQTLKTEYRVGEILTYRNNYTKFMPIQATVIQAFTDGIVYQLPDRTTDNPVGKMSFINTSVMVPAHLPSGKYHLSTTIVYRINALREIRYNARSNDFMVINNERELYGAN